MWLKPKRYVWVALVLIISLHYILSISQESYAKNVSIARLVGQLNINAAPSHNTDFPTQPHRANATFVFLCRNSDLPGVISSVQQMEHTFNNKFQYPWVLLNDEPFTDEFIQRVSVLTDAPISFGIIPREHWVQPDWIDEKKAEASRKQMLSHHVIYGGSVPYRNMCRFNSGFFFKHELLQPYRYYWRVEPDVKYFCDLDYDPFLLMQDQNKTYGFTITFDEVPGSIPTLWETAKEFIDNNPQYVAEDNAMEFLSNNGGQSYNLCHFWSNFEIADMDFWRGEAYQQYFDFLESKGGFYYERWGDAPVHSIAASVFQSKDKIHFFRDIGYRHDPYQRCPQGDYWSKGRCACDPKDSFDYSRISCLRRFEDMF